jgi:hypothetical protein
MRHLSRLLPLLAILAVSTCSAKDNIMTASTIDWKSLEFTCTKEKTPPLDPEADQWYRTARNLQKQDEERFAKQIVELYRKAIERNHYNAMHRLALMYVDGMGVEQDEREAVTLIERVIAMGVPSGYYQMGVFLQQGIGVKQDQAASLTYMRKAADMGNPQAQFAIGKKLLGISDKEVRPKLLPIAETMLQCALSQEVADAGYELGSYYAVVVEDPTKALRTLQTAGKLGHKQSLFYLKSAFENGEHGVVKDQQRAACYERLWRESEADKSKKFPNLDYICPLPPNPMPKG